MGAHVVLMGPSTVGKTSLMLGLTEIAGAPLDFTVERTCTTRKRRPDEGDAENVFLNEAEFEQRRPGFLFTFRTAPDYEYGITCTDPVGVREARLRILPAKLAVRFRREVQAPTILCSIAPTGEDPLQLFLRRDPNADPADVATRLSRFDAERALADEVADVRFQNHPGLVDSVAELSGLLIQRTLEVAPATVPTAD